MAYVDMGIIHTKAHTGSCKDSLVCPLNFPPCGLRGEGPNVGAR